MEKGWEKHQASSFFFFFFSLLSNISSESSGRKAFGYYWTVFSQRRFLNDVLMNSQIRQPSLLPGFVIVYPFHSEDQTLCRFLTFAVCRYVRICLILPRENGIPCKLNDRPPHSRHIEVLCVLEVSDFLSFVSSDRLSGQVTAGTPIGGHF